MRYNTQVTGRYRLNPVDQEQLAAQIVAVMDAHFKRPDGEEKNRILQLASEQITAEVKDQGKAESASSDTGGEASR